MTEPLRVAILGASGAVGQEFLELLQARKFPISELKLLGSKRSAGREVQYAGKKLLIEEASPKSFNNSDLVLSSAGSAVSRELIPHAVKQGSFVVDNTSAFRMDPKVPLVIPEINPEDIAKHNGIVANPNCSTIIMVVPLFPLHRRAKIKRIVVATYQAASGAGAKAMQELDRQSREILEGKPPTKEVFPHQIAFNLFSHNSAIDEAGFCEEEVKMVRETKKIFHDDSIQIIATTVRVPIFRAHSEAIFVELAEKLNLDDVRRLLEKAPGIRVVDDRNRNYFPMPIDSFRQDPILVGRLREDPSVENGFAMFVSGDQLRKGAALNAIQIAEIWAKNK